MLHRQLSRISRLTPLLAAITGLALLSAGCVTGGTDTSTAPENANAPAASEPAPRTPAPIKAREPDSYGLVETITIQPTGNAPKAAIPPLRFTFAKSGADRRLSFTIPDPVGEVIYLEKASSKYLIFPRRGQYVELDPQELGFQLGDLMSPAAAFERLKARAQYEVLGTENIDGRSAVKYRFTASGDTRTSVGTARADSIIFVDQATGLPLRSEIEATSTSGAGTRIVTETDSLVLSPAPGLFDVPVTLEKVSSAHVKQEVQGFVSVLRVVIDYLRQHAATAPPPESKQ
jgi:hypothetical protein